VPPAQMCAGTAKSGEPMNRPDHSAPRPGGDTEQLAPGPRGDTGQPDDFGCDILHVDMDAFYASVELREQPELRGRPMAVGGSGRGVVLSATYEARQRGITAPMPMTRARRLCADLVVLPPRFRLYAAVSAAVMEILGEITPLIEPLSMDEAFLDVRGAYRRLGTPAEIAELVRARIADEQGITASVGVASTKFVAKLASSHCKPDGLLVVPRDAVVPFLHTLPVGALWGVGERTEEQLLRLGLRTVADLANTPTTTLVRALGNAVGAHLGALAWGQDDRPVVPTDRERSVGAQQTFSRDMDDPMLVRRELLRLADRVASRMRAGEVQGRTVTLTVRFTDFTTITRSRTLRDPTDVGQEIYGTASELFAALGLQRARLRLVGVRMSQLYPVDSRPRQLAFDDKEYGWRAAERAIDRATHRFGPGAVQPASLVT
jgi:DNA polymerase IV